MAKREYQLLGAGVPSPSRRARWGRDSPSGQVGATMPVYPHAVRRLVAEARYPVRRWFAVSR